jgi:hypothetical protein
MTITTTLTRLAGGTVLAAAATAALAAPSSAMPAPGPDPVGTSTVQHVSGTATGDATDWQDVGIGLAGGVALAGAAYAASSALRRSRRPSLA